MTTVATVTDSQHASFCEDTQTAASGDHLCIGAGWTIADTDPLDFSERYVDATVLRRKGGGVDIEVTGIRDGAGEEVELRLLPATARSLAAALAQLADQAERSR